MNVFPLTRTAHFLYSLTMKRRLIGVLCLSILLMQFVAPSNAAVKPGSTCTKVNSTSISSGIKYTCIKSGTKLVWNKGVKVATPTASPSAKPAMTVSPSSTPITKPSASPTASETRRPQVITLPNIEKVEVGTDTKLGITTEANSGYTLESQSLNVCSIIGIYVVSFKAIGKCTLRVAVVETTRYLANSVMLNLNVVENAAAKAAADAAAKAAADAAAKAAAEAAKTIKYFTVTQSQPVSCSQIRAGSSFYSGEVQIPYTNTSGLRKDVYSGTFYRLGDGGYGRGTQEIWIRNDFFSRWVLVASGAWTPNVIVTCSYLG